MHSIAFKSQYSLAVVEHTKMSIVVEPTIEKKLAKNTAKIQRERKMLSLMLQEAIWNWL
jgi:alpha-D-ribose 1-methylphosphonate 5-triphosphate synthase subunit PhnL